MNLARKILNNITVVLEASSLGVAYTYIYMYTHTLYYYTPFVADLRLGLYLWICRYGLGMRVFTAHAYVLNKNATYEPNSC